jgi:hypothetical protein
MYRIVKLDRKTDKITDVLYEDITNIDEAQNRLLDAVAEHVSNWDDYTTCDMDNICYQGGEYVNSYKISIEEDGVCFI